MNRTKVLVVLLVFLVLLAMGTIFFSVNGFSTAKISNSDAVLLDFEFSDATAVSWSNQNGEFSFKLENGKWVDPGDVDFPVNQDAINERVESLVQYRASYKIDDVKNYAQYGLKNPEITITVETKQGSLVLKLGALSAMDNARYCCTDNGNVYMAETDVTELFSNDILTVMNVSNIPSMSDNRGLILSGINNLEIVYGRGMGYSYSDVPKLYLKENGKYLALGNLPAGNFLKTLDNYEFTSYEVYSADADDYEKYNLVNPDMTLSSDYIDDNGNECSYTFFVSKVGDAVYAKVEGSDIIYGWSNEAYDWLAGIGYNDLRSSSVLSLDWDFVESIDLTVDSQTYTITTVKGSDGNISYAFDGEAAACSDITSGIEHLAYTEYTNDLTSKTLELAIRVKTNEAHDVTVRAYRYDGDSCIVTVDGQCEGLVTRESVIDLRESILDIALGLN